MSRRLILTAAAGLIAASLAVLPVLAAADFPVTVKNCGSQVTLTAAPQRIFVINNDDVALLAALDALDLVVGRTAELPANVYEGTVSAAMAKVPLVASETGPTGGSVISFETILAARPDLVLAPENAVDRQLLADAGIALYSPPAYCTDPDLIPAGTASFERVYEQLLTFGALLGRPDAAAAAIADLKQEVAAIGANHNKTYGSAVALYIAAGGKAIYPYGGRSMVTPVFAAAGLTNAYGATDERVFEASMEDLLGRNPDVIVLLYSDGTPDAVLAAFNSLPGVESFAAVKAGRVVPLAFSFTDPPTPNSIKGATVLAQKLSALP